MAAPPRTAKKPARKPDKRVERRPARGQRARVAVASTVRSEVAASEPRGAKKSTGRSVRDVKNEANGLYRARNFTGAASVLTSSLSSFAGDDAQDLRTLAKIYAQLGRSYNVGMAPGTKPIEAFQALRRAVDYDREVGSSFIAELQGRLVNVAPRAAGSFMAAKQYESAFQAVRTAEALGSTSPSNKSVRGLLEQIARDLLRAATAERSTDPESAKRKLRQILGIVDARNPVYGRAQKQLNGP